MMLLTLPTSSELACSTIKSQSDLTVTSMSTAPWNHSLLGSTLSRSAYDSAMTVRGSRMSVHGSRDPSSARSLSTRPGPSVSDAVPASSSAAPQVGRRLSRTTDAMSRAARMSERTARLRTAAVKRVQRHGIHRRLGRSVPVPVSVGIDSSISSFSGPLIATTCPPSSLTFAAELSTLGRSVIGASPSHVFISHSQNSQTNVFVAPQTWKLP